MVFALTGGAIYGECEQPAREDDPCRPLSPYGAAKLAGEGYVATFGRLYESEHVTLRLGNIYGPRQDPHGEAGVVAIFLGLLADGGIPIVYGDGEQTRDYVYVGDVVRATLAAAEAPAGVYNVGTGQETSARAARGLLRCRRRGGRAAVRRTSRGSSRAASSTPSSPSVRSDSERRCLWSRASARPGAGFETARRRRRHSEEQEASRGLSCSAARSVLG